MRYLSVILSTAAFVFAQPSFAQSQSESQSIDELLNEANPPSENTPVPNTPGEVPQVDPDADVPDAPDIAPLPEPETPTDDDIETRTLTINPPVSGNLPEVTITEPDYSDMTEAQERAARLDALFARLKSEDNTEDADLIAESIWAIWLDSGSDSVNLLLRRGTAAEKRGDDKLARTLYDHVTTLQPDYAEGWSRSARLAIEEDDLSRALSEVTKALILEERHFYALWTLGNIFERIGKTDAAFEAYSQANALYPELKAVKDRLGVLRQSVEGDAL
ncbi:tetratricopeptide repeat protein [Fretibacter rubidus]|uniref:tetratricopeptide repeat protein n=1 Tax=Fretibacter rubidus TaxID=570162 RepID=UPI00352A41D0